MGQDEEFAEFDTTEDEFDAMMAAGEPAEVVTSKADLDAAMRLCVIVSRPSLTRGGRTRVRPITPVGGVSVSSGTGAAPATLS
jgi:hypothetical protein